MLIVALLVGAVVGGLAAEGFGAAVGALLGWLLVRSWRQGEAIAELRRALAAEKAPAPVVAAAPAPVAEVAAGEEPATPAAEPAPAMPLGIDVPPAAGPELAPATTTRPAPWQPLQAWLLGGNTIVKAGVGILFVGLAFLAKYATEHFQVAVELRLAGIGVAALVLLVLGWRLRGRRPAYAQVLQGGAVAVLYLTLFVAFRWFGLLGVLPAFVLMVVVAALAAALAVLQDAPALALVGALGGFTTPLLVSSGSGNVVALFSYYLVLDLGIAAVAWFRTWRVLNLVGFAFTFVVATAWGVLRYAPADFALGQAFLVAFFLLFNAVLLMPARRADAAPRGPDRWVNGGLLFGLPTITFVLQHGLVQRFEFGSALSALVLGAFYVALAAAVRARPRLAALFDGSLAVALVFVTLVIPFALDDRSTAGAWALEGAALVWIGVRQRRRLARAFGLVLLLLAGPWLGAVHGFHPHPAGGFDSLAFNALLVAAAALAGAFFARRRPEPALPGEAFAEPLLIGWGTLWALLALRWQVDALGHADQAPAAWVAGLSAIAAVFGTLAWRLQWPRVALPTLGHAPLLALALLGTTALGASPADGGGWWAWPLASAAHLWLLRVAVPGMPAPARAVVHALGLLLLAALGALQGRAFSAEAGDAGSAWVWLGGFVAPALLLLLLLQPRLRTRWPLGAEPAAYETAAGLVAAALLLWSWVANAASDGSAAPLPHLPLANPLDLGVAFALYGAARWLQRDAAQPLRRALPRLAPALLGGSGFFWLNGMLVRAFHHYGGVPYRFDAWARSLAVQTGLALLWTATALALMWVSARRGLRAPWMAGALLLAAVVVKLLLVDLSGTGTVARIVSFIGVGALMLVIGYVAPLPGKADSHAAA